MRCFGDLKKRLFVSSNLTDKLIVKTKTLKYQLLFPIIIFISLLIGLLGYFNYTFKKNKMNDELTKSIYRTSQRLEKNLSRALYEFDEQTIQSILFSELEKENVGSLAIIDMELNKITFGLTKDKKNKIIETKEFKYLNYTNKTKVGKITVPKDEERYEGQFIATYLIGINETSIKKQLVNEIIITVFTIIFLNLAIGFLIYYLLNKEIVEPIIEISNISSLVSNGDFSKRVRNKYTFGKQNEIQLLSISMNNMTDEIEKLTTNLNFEAEKKSQKIKKQYKDFKNLLFNLDEGYLIFDKEGIVVSESTEITKDMFQTNPLNKSMVDIFQLNYNEKKNFKNWLHHIFNGIVPFKDIVPLAPQIFNKINGRVIALEYKPLFLEQSNKKIDKVICIANDITEKIDLEKKAKFEKEKSQRLINILERPVDFLDLISDADEIINHYVQNLKNSSPDNIFRSFHNLKARFSSFKLNEIVGNIHNLESFLNEIENKWTETQITEVWNLLEEIRFDYSEYMKNNRKLIEIANNSVSSSDEGVNAATLMKSIESFYSQYYKNFVLKEVSVLFKQFILPTQELAKRQDKSVKINIKESEVFINSKKYKTCFSTFIHIFRNSIDHGIESREERASKNKSTTGNLTIYFELMEEIESFKIIIKDDGKGIDPNIIKEIATSKSSFDQLKIKNLSNKETIQLIFEPGYSSKEEVSEISGRGIGMSSVKSEIENMNGFIQVFSKIDEGTKFEIVLPLLA